MISSIVRKLSGMSMALLGAAIITGVPAFGLPKISSLVGRIFNPTLCIGSFLSRNSDVEKMSVGLRRIPLPCGGHFLNLPSFESKAMGVLSQGPLLFASKRRKAESVVPETIRLGSNFATSFLLRIRHCDRRFRHSATPQLWFHNVGKGDEPV